MKSDKPEGSAMSQSNWKSLIDLLSQTAKKWPQKEALFYRQEDTTYHPITYATCLYHIQQLASGLSKLGLLPGDRVAILCTNRPEWMFSDFAILSLGCIVVPIYPTLSAQEIAYILNDCQAKILILESSSHTTIVQKIWPECSSLLQIITLCEPSITPPHDTQKVIGFNTLCPPNPSPTPEQLDSWFSYTATIDTNTVASIVYTSGTTGHPKGVILTHGNFLSNVAGILAITPVGYADSALSFLPLSHVFERTVGYYTLLAVGGSIYYAKSIATLSQDLQLAKPTVLVSVPRVYEKMHDKIVESLSGLKKWLFYLAFYLPCRNRFTDKWIFSKIRQKTGGRLRFFVSGGAPLSKELGLFFNKLGLLIIEGYGMTETSPVIACNQVSAYKFGTVGKALPNVQTKQAEDGELLVKGPSVMVGYWANSETIIDSQGWLHTGDIVRQDAEGFIEIIDRKKELIVLSNGKKIPPQLIEKCLLKSPYISQAIVIGDNKNYLSALLVPHISRVKQHVPALRLVAENKWPTDAVALAFFNQIVTKACADLAPFEQVKKIILLMDELTPESGFLTPTLKPKRRIIASHFKTIIDALYTSERTIK